MGMVLQMISRPRVPAGFIAAYPHKTRAELIAYHGIGKSTYARWVKDAGLPPKTNGNPSKPLPANIRELAAGKNITQLAKAIGFNKGTLTDRLAQQHPDILAACKGQRTKQPIPADFATAGIEMSMIQLSEHYELSEATLRLWIKDMPREWQDERARAIKNRMREAAKANPGFRLPRVKNAALPSRVSGDIASQAAHHLRRWFTPVFDAGKVYGGCHAGMYCVGSMRVTRDEMLAMAAERGFDANAWRRAA